MASEREERIAALSAEVARAQARYDRQKANPAAHTGYSHTVAWMDLTKRKLAAEQAGRPDSWRRHRTGSLPRGDDTPQATTSTPVARAVRRKTPLPNRSPEPFLRAARALRSFWADGDSRAHTRLFEILIRDEYVVVGSSGHGGTYREHAVPLSLIRNHCFSMFGEGKSDVEVAAFIERHLKIVLITNEEAQHLDGKLGLRTKMPPGWTVGDDVMARFVAAGLTVVPMDGPELGGR